MPFDSVQAKVLSDNFRIAVTNRFDSEQRLEFERLLQISLGIKNIRNVQLWTRFGAATRNFISRNLGEYEMDLRTTIAFLVVNNASPSAPVKQVPFVFPITNFDAERFTGYLNDEYIQAYSNRLYPAGRALILEYLADSGVEIEKPDFDSPEFEDVLED